MYGLFVNIVGKVDFYILVDLEMEYFIKRIKKFFKVTGLNNLEGLVVKKLRVLVG